MSLSLVCTRIGKLANTCSPHRFPPCGRGPRCGRLNGYAIVEDEFPSEASEQLCCTCVCDWRVVGAIRNVRWCQGDGLMHLMRRRLRASHCVVRLVGFGLGCLSVLDLVAGIDL